MELKKLRRKIDKIDEEILDALSARAKITLLISRLKKRHGRAMYSPDRESEILNRLELKNKGPLSDKAITAIYREIMSSTSSLGYS